MLNVWKRGWMPWGYPRNWITNIKHFFRCLKWSYQRIVKGYCDYDTWNLDCYLTDLIADSVDFLADNTHGYPGDDTPEGASYEVWQYWLHGTAEMLRRSQEDYFYENEFQDEFYKVCEKRYVKTGSDALTPEDEAIRVKYWNRENEIMRARRNDLDTAMERLVRRWWNLWD